MSNYKRLFVFVTVLLFPLIQRTNGLKCYTCTYPINEGCKDPFDVTQYTYEDDCKDPDMVCVKHENSESYFEAKHLQRGCVSENYCEEERYSAVHCSICRTDLCNSSLKVNPSLVIISIVFISSLIRTIFN